MFKMSTGVAALFVAGLLGLGCDDQSGLKPRGGTGGAAGAAKGGQAGGGVAGGSGGAIGTSGSGGAIAAGGVSADSGGAIAAGGVSAGSGGAIAAGGVSAGGTGGASGSGGTVSCLPIACPALACVSGFQPNPDPCGCPICGPSPDAGATKDSGGPDIPSYCMLADCPMLRPCLSGYPPDPNPCGCPVCLPTDAGITKDSGGPDTPPICPGPIPPCVPPPQTCPAGYQFYSPPCGCTFCAPVDGGTAADAAKADGPPACTPVACPIFGDCVGGFQPNPDPCGCPICAPNPDAGTTCVDEAARIAALCPTFSSAHFDGLCARPAPECVTRCLAEVSSCSDFDCTFCEVCRCAADRFSICYGQCEGGLGH